MSDQMLWFIGRATGLVLLPTFTAVVVLGILTSGGRRLGRAPRFVTLALHRSLSLASVGFLAVHIATMVIDEYTSIRLLDVVVPFIAGYEKLWTGFGTVGVLLLVLLLATSLARVRLGYRLWRTLHATSWLFFAVSFAHGIGIGSDTRTWWGLALSAVCVLAVVVAFVTGRSKPAWRASTPPRRPAVLEGADR